MAQRLLLNRRFLNGVSDVYQKRGFLKLRKSIPRFDKLWTEDCATGVSHKENCAQARYPKTRTVRPAKYFNFRLPVSIHVIPSKAVQG
jgi:hypothetical protein